MAPTLASLTAPIAGPSTATVAANTNKRPAPSSSATLTTIPSAPLSDSPPAKRPRTSDTSADGSVDDEDDGDEDDEVSTGAAGQDGNADLASREKMARKEARTIRNRESAQRSRNQRKAHLAWLEVRVVELEAENARLRGSSASPAAADRPAPRSGLSPGPGSKAGPIDVHTLASDLGVPQSVVSGTGIALASVAPPPRDLDLEDIKPVIPVSSGSVAQSGSNARLQRSPTPLQAIDLAGVTVNGTESDQQLELRQENAALRERILLLENLVKQVVAVSNLGGLPASGVSTSAAMTASVSSTSASASFAVQDKASPTLFPASPVNQPLPSNPSFDLSANNLSANYNPSSASMSLLSTSTPFSSANANLSQASQSATAHNTLARHSAVVATSVLVTKDEALQRARKHVIVPQSSGTCLRSGTEKAERSGNDFGFVFGQQGSTYNVGTGHTGVSFVNGGNGIQGQAGSEGGLGAGEIEGMVDFSFLDNVETDQVVTANNGIFDLGFDAPRQVPASSSYDASASAFGSFGTSDWSIPLNQAQDVQDGQMGADGEVNEDGWDVRMSKLIEDLESRVAGMEDEQQQQQQQRYDEQGLGLDLGLGLGQGMYGVAGWAS